MTIPRILLGALAVLLLAIPAAAGDAYFHASIKDLNITEGKLPDQIPNGSQRSPSRVWRLGDAMQPYGVLNGQGEIYVQWEMPYLTYTPTHDGQIVVRAPAGADVTGTLFLPKHDLSGMVSIKFKLPADAAKDKDAKKFYLMKMEHYHKLWQSQIPGGAWFRHEMREAERKFGNTPDENGLAPLVVQSGVSRVDDTLDLFSGGRAVAENLQLERTLPNAKEDVPTVAIDSLGGITIAEIDWKEKLKDKPEPKLDALAAAVPADQHAVFFPTFAKLIEVSDRAEEQGTRILTLAEPRSEDAGIKRRYEKQLCLSTSDLARLIGPQVVRSVAITGSDPYFATGTDVAVLFEAVNGPTLHALLGARIALGAAADRTAKSQGGAVDGVGYTGFLSPDRSVSVYLARMDDVVVATNSLAQLAQLTKVHRGKLAAINTLPEFKFFRARYALGDAEESALLFLSDATIRRWCSPRWRIASSRRTRDAATLSELQCAYLDSLVSGKVESGPIHTDLPIADNGELRLTQSGVRSSELGSLDFQTPIVELPLEKVSEREAEMYKRWRDTYQQNWNWAFDPIALRITADDKKLAADLSVMPLIVNTEYRSMLGFAQGAVIKSTAGDPHDALVHFILAFNRESEMVRSADNMLQGLLQGMAGPTSWIGSSIAVYADADPFWKELAEQKDDSAREKFFEKNLNRIPIAIDIEVANPLKLTAFIVALRGMAEQSAPGMLVWESLKYNDQAYVKVGPSEAAKGQLPPEVKNPGLYYSITGEHLLLTFSEPLLKRALDRQAVQRKAKAEGRELPAPDRPWLGTSACFQIDSAAIGLLGNVLADQYQVEMQRRAWGNLPILNEWHRRYPDHEPADLQERWFGVRPICPGGGKYVWNDRWQTMESTVYGSPAEQKTGAAMPPLLGQFRDLNFGLTFEDKGLRSRVELRKVERDSTNHSEQAR